MLFRSATNVNDVVPEYLASGRFEPRPSIQTIANAMDVGNPSNFERMSWLYGRDVGAMRRDVRGCRYTDDETRATIADVYARRGYVLDPHSAIAYRGLKDTFAGVGTPKRAGVFLATAHPAKFGEIVEPVLGRAPDLPPPLQDALARPRHILRLDASLEAVRGTLDG